MGARVSAILPAATDRRTLLPAASFFVSAALKLGVIAVSAAPHA